MTDGIYVKLFKNFFGYIAADLSTFFPKQKVELKAKEEDDKFIIMVRPFGLFKLIKKAYKDLKNKKPISLCTFHFSTEEQVLSIKGHMAIASSCFLLLINALKSNLIKKRDEESQNKMIMAKSHSIKFTFRAIIEKSGHRVKKCSLAYNPINKNFQLEVNLLVLRTGKRNNSRKIRISDSDMKKLIESFKIKMNSLK